MSYPIAKKRRSLGFTLIELLVVISIIGMLSSVVLASLKRARDKAQDAKVRAQLRNFKTHAEIYRSTNGNYGPQVLGIDTQPRGTSIAHGCAVPGSMFADPQIAPYFAEVNNPPFVIDPTQSRCLALDTDVAGSFPANRYVIMVKLSAPNHYYCIDSTGIILDGIATSIAIPRSTTPYNPSLILSCNSIFSI